jgi:hypothetical protein
LICSASRLGPANPSSQSSAYAEVGVMPILVPDALVRAADMVLVAA